MPESVFNFLRNPEGKKGPKLRIETFGSPKQEVVEAVKSAVNMALEEMGWSGPPPKVGITEEYIDDKYGGPLAGMYEFSTKRVLVGQGLLQSSLLTDSGDVPDEALAALVAAEETAHYVQDMQGRLPHAPYVKDSESDDEHYRNHDYEVEAGRISVRVANRLFPNVGFSRRHQGIDE